MQIEVKREGAYWSVYVDGIRTVDRESFATADRIAEALRHPERQGPSESNDVAESIRRWRESW